jgi:hypothetical protein
MATFDELHETTVEAKAAMDDSRQRQPNPRGPVLTGTCSEDVRLAGEWQAAMESWQAEHEPLRDAHLAAYTAELRAWDGLLAAAWEENELRGQDDEHDAA